MQKIFDAISDAGHGWAKIPLSVLAELGLSRADFTSYSYLTWNARKGCFNPVIYLEEDCDLTKFVNAYVAANGFAPKFRDRYCQQSRLRTSGYNNSPEYDRYFQAIAA